MNSLNGNGVKVGDRVRIKTRFGALYVSDIAVVEKVTNDYVCVQWEDINLRTLLDSMYFHHEYEVIPQPRLTTSEKIAFVLIVLGAIFAFSCRAMGLYDN